MAIKCITEKIEEAQQRLKIQVLHLHIIII